MFLCSSCIVGKHDVSGPPHIIAPAPTPYIYRIYPNTESPYYSPYFYYQIPNPKPPMSNPQPRPQPHHMPESHNIH